MTCLVAPISLFLLRNGVPFSSEPFLPLVEHPKFTELLAIGSGDGLGGALLVPTSEPWPTEAW